MESYIYQRLIVAGSQGSITFSRPALHEIYKFSRGTPRLINLLCDRALLGGFVEQTHHIEKGIINKAKDSLLGEETRRLSHSFSLTQRLTLLRLSLLTTFIFLLTAMAIINQDYLSPVQHAKNFVWEKIQNIYLQVSNTIPPSVSALPLNKEPDQHSAKNEAGMDSEKESQEVPK
jgi:uncharacterized membrane protein YbaN (DUF454 family)